MVIRTLVHPWDLWFQQMKPKTKKMKQEDYPSIVLHRGVDYGCLTHSFAMQFRRQATARDCRIHCQVREDGDALEVCLAKT